MYWLTLIHNFPITFLCKAKLNNPHLGPKTFFSLNVLTGTTKLTPKANCKRDICDTAE